MRVLLDENLPHDLIATLSDHTVLTVQGLGWAGVKNGELLGRASGLIDAFVTMDRLLGGQQDLSKLPFGVVLIVARSNRMHDLQALLSRLREGLGRARPGTFEQIGS